MRSKKLLTFLIIFLIFILAFIFYPYRYKLERKIDRSFPKPTLTLDKPFDKRIVFLGDSMTEYLGNFEDLRNFLLKYYPDKRILLLNYGYSSTNILSAMERIEKDTTHSGRIFEPISNIPYDLIFIESFAYNPLSEYPVDQGLNLQTLELDKIVKTLKEKHPNSKVIFIATIAPLHKDFAKGNTDLSSEKRVDWAKEREAYLENHIKYAKDHNIKILDLYHQTKNINGEGTSLFINPLDNIHPSPIGVYYISKEIADFINKNKLLDL